MYLNIYSGGGVKIISPIVRDWGLSEVYKGPTFCQTCAISYGFGILNLLGCFKTWLWPFWVISPIGLFLEELSTKIGY